MICCKKCGYVESEEKGIELHHLIPKFMGGNDMDGRVYLCKKHHNILHNLIPKIIFNFVSDEKKELCKQSVKIMSEKYIGLK